jgi:hypothetical protein
MIGEDWIQLAQKTDQWLALVNTEIISEFQKMLGT